MEVKRCTSIWFFAESFGRTLQDVHTPYVMILDSSVVLTKHSRLDILAYVYADDGREFVGSVLSAC